VGWLSCYVLQVGDLAGIYGHDSPVWNQSMESFMIAGHIAGATAGAEDAAESVAVLGRCTHDGRVAGSCAPQRCCHGSC
jgi:hypothetical protein